MNSVMLRKQISPVQFDSVDVAEAIVEAGDDVQREVLIAMANAVDAMGRTGGSWPMQCRYIVDGASGKGLHTLDRSRIASMLGCLIDHLNE